MAHIPKEQLLASILSQLSNRFIEDKRQEGRHLLQAFPSGTSEQVQQFIQALAQQDPHALGTLQRITTLTSQAIALQVAERYPELSTEQQAALTTFFTYFRQVERVATAWFSTIEGHACSADRGRTLRRMIWRHLVNQTPPEPNYSQQYTYHLSDGSLVTAEEIQTWYQHFLGLQQGDFVRYSRALLAGSERYHRRQHSTDLAPERTPPLDEALTGKPSFVIRGAFERHAPEWDEIENRIVVVSYTGEFSELDPFIHHKTRDGWKKKLLRWALANEPLDIPMSMRKYFKQPSDFLSYLALRRKAMQGDREEYLAVIEQIRHIKKHGATSV